MQLGASLFSPSRWHVHRLAVFAQWDDDAAIDDFLDSTSLGRTLSAGWHVRMNFLRRWGHVDAFDGLPRSTAEEDLDAPVVAVTLARLKVSQSLRFIRWGKPVEELVRDAAGTTLALAATRPVGTLSTFSVWESTRQMIDMVRGTGETDRPERHAAAMAERNRKDFHHEFTTLRFAATSEHGSWQGRTGIVPGCPAVFP